MFEPHRASVDWPARTGCDVVEVGLTESCAGSCSKLLHWPKEALSALAAVEAKQPRAPFATTPHFLVHKSHASSRRTRNDKEAEALVVCWYTRNQLLRFEQAV